MATLLLTGGRPSEVLGLTVSDVTFDRETVRIRGTKTLGSDRTMPLWPQPAAILQPYVRGLGRTPDSSSRVHGRENPSAISASS